MELSTLASDAEATGKPESADLTAIRNKLEELDTVTILITQVEIELKEAKERKRELLERILPEMMDELGLGIVGTEDGELTVEVINQINAGIPKKFEREAHAWLENNGFGDLIKSEIKVALGRGEVGMAKELLALIEKDYHLEPSMKQAVHYQTLKAFVKEQMEKGVDLPADLLGIYAVRIAKVKK